MIIDRLVKRAEEIVPRLKNGQGTHLPGAQHLLITRLQGAGLETAPRKAIPSELFLAAISREQLICSGLTIAR
jgi:hypothetical protein